jgi:hypothetical protein
MRIVILAALLCASSPALTQTAAIPGVPDHSNSRTVDGSWNQSAIAGGIEAVFRNSAGQPQLFLTCTRATRQVSVARPAAGAAPILQVWTSSASRNLPASFNPATRRISATLRATDSLLDAMALSRGRIAVGVAGQPAIVAPAWGEISRVVEECRL